jgi:hypothetical protein
MSCTSILRKTCSQRENLKGNVQNVKKFQKEIFTMSIYVLGLSKIKIPDVALSLAMRLKGRV